MKNLLVNKLMMLGATAKLGVMATIDVSAFKDAVDTVVCLFGGILVLRGIATLSEGQGENNAAAKAQGFGLIGGGLVLVVGGLMVVNVIFSSI